MAMERVEWLIRGIRPLMQNNPEAMAAATAEETTRRSGKTTRKTLKAPSPDYEEAKGKLYVSNGHFYHPAQAAWTSIVEACPNTKIGNTATSGILPPAIDLITEELILYDPDTLDSKKPVPLKEKDWLLDRRFVPAMNTKGQVVGIFVPRPKWPKWGVILPLDVERDVIPERYTSVITDILNIAGTRGWGSGRLRRAKNTSTWVGIRMGKFTAELRV